MGLNSIPFGLKTASQEELQDFSVPLPLLNLTFVEGTNIPIFTRGETAKESPFPAQDKRRTLKYGKAQTDNGMPWIIFSQTPSTDPLFVGKVTETPTKGLVLRRKKQTLAVATTFTKLGSRTMEVPATEYSVSVREVLDEIQMHLLEVVGGNVWSLWTHGEVLRYLHDRVVRFIMETGIIRDVESHTEEAREVDLPSDLLEIRRVGWNGVALQKIDPFVLDHGIVGWEDDTGTPYAYVEEPRDPLSVQLVPTPDVPGTFSVVYVAPTVNILQATQSRDPHLPIPAAFCPHIKYGVMADMLMKEGEAHDPVRAQYCEQRYEEGVQLARLWMGALE